MDTFEVPEEFKKARICKGTKPTEPINVKTVLIARSYAGLKDLYMGNHDLAGAKVVGTTLSNDGCDYSISLILKTTKGSYIELIINQEV